MRIATKLAKLEFRIGTIQQCDQLIDAAAGIGPSSRIVPLSYAGHGQHRDGLRDVIENDHPVEERRSLLRSEAHRRPGEMGAFTPLVRDEPDQPVRLDELVIVDEHHEIGIDRRRLVEGAVAGKGNPRLRLDDVADIDAGAGTESLHRLADRGIRRIVDDQERHATFRKRA